MFTSCISSLEKARSEAKKSANTARLYPGERVSATGRLPKERQNPTVLGSLHATCTQILLCSRNVSQQFPINHIG